MYARTQTHKESNAVNVLSLVTISLVNSESPETAVTEMEAWRRRVEPQRRQWQESRFTELT